ncbi:MAG: hypothetical protein H0T42_20600 [Deltaproteobacteria bacterium]|nr:hypothetical protein [Deltaproteobacteria bacterium]
MSSRWIVLIVAVATLIGCRSRREPRADEATPVAVPHDDRQAARPADADAGFAWYRVEARVDDLGVVPFLIAIHRERPEGLIYAAEENLPMVVVQRDPLVLRIPVRGLELRLAPDGTEGRLRGSWVAGFYWKRDFDIVAEPVAGPNPELLFPGGEPPAVDLSGSWRIDIKEFGVGRATFRQDSNGTISGTIIPPEIGDLRHLTGRVNGNQVRMSAFDGIHGFFMEMTASDGGQRLEGRWLVAGLQHYRFTATRKEAPPTHLKVSARMAPGKTRLSLPALDRPPYLGNPVIIDYFGSWCPVCLDLTPELVRLHREHAATGLQVLSFALEPEGDEVATQRRLDEFRAAFKVPWTFEVIYNDDFAEAFPREILDATGFPLTIYLRRDHTVAAIHTGFVSRAAGADHDAAVKHINELTAKIVAPPPASPPAKTP